MVKRKKRAHRAGGSKETVERIKQFDNLGLVKALFHQNMVSTSLGVQRPVLWFLTLVSILYRFNGLSAVD